MADIAELQINLFHEGGDPAYRIYMTGQGSMVSHIVGKGCFSLPAVGVDKAYGKALYSALFPQGSEIDEGIRAAFRDTVSKGIPLRVRLFIQSDPDEVLSKHHWEMLCDPVSGEWLFTNDLIYFRRYLRFQGDLDTTPPRAGPLRALVVIVNPADLRDSWEEGDPIVVRQLTRIRVEDEKPRAQKGLRELAAQVKEIVSGPGMKVTIQELWQALNVHDGWDVVYLVCHGGFMANGPEGAGYYLLLEGDNKASELVPIGALISQIKGQAPDRRPRLVVLVSCQSGDSRTSADKGSLVGIGQRLVQEAGVLAAVAMQGNFTMDTAEIFIPAFFDALRGGDGLVERAMAAARRRTSGRLDWFIPVLFARAWDGRLWPNPGTVAGDVAQRRLERRRIYIAHPALASVEEAATFDSVKRLLSGSSYDVIESEKQPVSGDRWIRRALLDLGTCDGAVLILTEGALTSLERQLQDEARLLCWRTWLEPEFRVVTLTLSPACGDLLQGEIWRLLCPSNIDCIPMTPEADRAAGLKTSLERLQTVSNRASPWRVQDLQDGITRRIRGIGLESKRLATAAEDLRNQGAHGLLIDQEDVFAWWAGALLCKGPTLLRELVSNLEAQLDPDSREKLKSLLIAITPSWVDITAVSPILRIVKQTNDQTNPRTRSFHVAIYPSMNPQKVADPYLKRAFGFAGDNPWRAYSPALRGVKDKEEAIRTELAARLGVDVTDNWGLSSPEDDGNQDGNAQNKIDDAIKNQVNEKERNGHPVILLLDDRLIQEQPLLRRIRERFGPIAFFFLGFGQQVVKEAGILSLEPPPTAEAYCQTQEALQYLKDIL